MLIGPDEKLTRIGVFYDGGYFAEVRKFYKYYHEPHQNISVGGLHEFVKKKVAKEEPVDERFCRVVDAHYFRGRFSAQQTEQREGQLLRDRTFDDVLMRAGVITHYLPRLQKKETGIDVWFALEAFELAIYKRFNVLALLACDGDFLPLVRKLNTLGTRVMLLQWDFEYDEKVRNPKTGVEEDRHRETHVAQVLLDEVTYPINMRSEIEDRDGRVKRDSVIAGLFIPEPEENIRSLARHASPNVSTLPAQTGEEHFGRVTKNPFGKSCGNIVDQTSGKGVFFPASSIERPLTFADLKDGDLVRYTLGKNPSTKPEFAEQPMALHIRRVDSPAPLAISSQDTEETVPLDGSPGS